MKSLKSVLSKVHKNSGMAATSRRRNLPNTTRKPKNITLTLGRTQFKPEMKLKLARRFLGSL
jgi:hypothetical protein